MRKIPKWYSKPVWVKISFYCSWVKDVVRLIRAFESTREAGLYAKEYWVPGTHHSIEPLRPATRLDLQPKIPIDLKDTTGPSIVRVNHGADPFTFPFGDGNSLILR